MGGVGNAHQLVAPANAGAHTPRPTEWGTIRFNKRGWTKRSVCHRASSIDHAVWVPAFAGTTVERGLRHTLQKRLFRGLHRVGGSDMHPDAVEPQAEQPLLFVGTVEHLRQ